MNDYSITERKIFLSKADLFLEQDLYQSALDLAESRLYRFPEDIDAKIIKCRALVKMGAFDKAKELVDEMEDTIRSLSKMFECMGDIFQKTGITKEAATFYSRFIPINKSNGVTRKTDANSDDINSVQIGTNFYTLTLAELYIKQSHFEAASNILKEIIKKDPQNQKAAERLRDIERTLNGKGENKPASLQGRARLINELTRWLENIHRIRTYAV
jgi:tetratricopeptide (TPR) repeat protein